MKWRKKRMENMQNILRRIPKIDEVLQDRRLVLFYGTTPRSVIVDSVRETIDHLRKEILAGNTDGLSDKEALLDEIVNTIIEKKRSVLRRVVNATGVVLHTNLGRAQLSKAAAQAVVDIADNYCTLEYDLKKGMRGSRQDIVENIIKKVTGAEAAMVVNNNAAATMIVLAAMARGKEVIVSRGELVEIGGSFRIPEVMSESGAILREVGATNKTKLSDYENAYNEEATGAFMKVHTSNYRIIGFTEDVSLSDMVALGREKQVPVIYDMGNGLMVDLQRWGVKEPTVMDALKADPDVILFSGDKLLGGPQGGIIIGKKQYIDQMKSHPLARAFRVDKMTLAAMEATFFQYLDLDRARNDIPTLAMICMDRNVLRERAELLKRKLEEKLSDWRFSIEEVLDQVGGGSAPANYLEGLAVACVTEGMTAEQIERKLRRAETPVIARVSHEKVLIDVRCIREEEFSAVVSAFEKISKQKNA